MMDKGRYINFAKFKDLEDLSSVDGNSFIGVLIDKFLFLLPDRINRVAQCIHETNYERLNREIHTFLLSSEILGAFLICDTLKKIKIASENQKETELRSLLSELKEAAICSDKELKFYLQKYLN